MADDEAKYKQALRFLTSLQSQKSQDVDSQRAFLQSKGLSEDVITRAFQDVKRPDSIGDEVASRAAVNDYATNEDDSNAFEKAAKMFDQPLTVDPETSSSSQAPPAAPPKTYPKSPLALYQQQQLEQQQTQAQLQQQAYPSNNPITRYDVLLSFFRSMCYLLVLGGGITGVLVALYRTYLLPRLVTTLDCRSLLLKDHLDQFSVLTNRIKSLRSNSLAPNLQQAVTTAPRKGVLKKVQFADDVIVDEKRPVEVEEKKEAGELEAEKGKVEVDEKRSGEAVEGKHEGGRESEEKEIVVQPLDVLQPIRNSLARLSQSLKADVSASALGTEISPPVVLTPSARATTTATTVEEESDADSWVSEEDSDELEFDPYSSSSTAPSKRKHGPSAATKTTSITSTPSNSSSSTIATSLNSSLSTLNAYMNSQTYMASAHVYGSKSLGMGIGSSSEKEASKAGDVAQIRADIRNLKGLLLSRRNFPIYRTSPAATTPAAEAV